MPDVLDTAALDRGLARLDGWRGSPDGGISKAYEFDDFAGSIAFVNRVAAVAEEANHHPDLAISWNKVTLTYITHSAGGVTSADVAQAEAIEQREAGG